MRRPRAPYASNLKAWTSVISCSKQGSSLDSSTKKNILASIALIDRALALDPNYVWALRDGAPILQSLCSAAFRPIATLMWHAR